MSAVARKARAAPPEPPPSGRALRGSTAPTEPPPGPTPTGATRRKRAVPASVATLLDMTSADSNEHVLLFEKARRSTFLLWQDAVSANGRKHHEGAAEHAFEILRVIEELQRGLDDPLHEELTDLVEEWKQGSSPATDNYDHDDEEASR